jgi:hypothetical protein
MKNEIAKIKLNAMMQRSHDRIFSERMCLHLGQKIYIHDNLEHALHIANECKQHGIDHSTLSPIFPGSSKSVLQILQPFSRVIRTCSPSPSFPIWLDVISISFFFFFSFFLIKKEKEYERRNNTPNTRDLRSGLHRG